MFFLTKVHSPKYIYAKYIYEATYINKCNNHEEIPKSKNLKCMLKVVFTN